ncbi:MAG: hypothetical protein K8R58_05545 [Bacteroidales bacterium]|nr:hypothetical protein [Bacteroidales bacterium]
MNKNHIRYLQIINPCNIFKLTKNLKLCIFFILLFSFSITKAQDKPDYKTVNNLTYKLYEQKKWDSLISEGKNALKNDMDYFYLRMRLGIAYYEKKNYLKAIQHFEKALIFNSNDTTAMEYLYYSYMFSGRELEARASTAKFPGTLISKLKIGKNRIINNIYFETGPTFSNNISKNKKTDLLGNDSIFGEQNLNNNMFYLHFGIRQNIKKRFSVYFGYTNLQISKLKQIQTSEIVKAGYDTIHTASGYYVDTLYKKKSNHIKKNEYILYQNTFYVNSDIYLGKSYTLTPAFHLINIRYKTIYAKYELEQYYAQSYDTIPSVKAVYSFSKKNTSYNNFVVYLAITKTHSRFSFGLFNSYSNLNNKDQFQIGSFLSYYPMGNMNFYTNTTLVYFSENNNNRIIFDQLAGIKILPKLWSETYITLGNLKNYNEKNAFVVYNTGDKINYKFGTKLIYSLSKKIELSLLYHFLSKESTYITYTDYNNYKTTETKYQNQNIIGGIKWKL